MAGGDEGQSIFEREDWRSVARYHLLCRSEGA